MTINYPKFSIGTLSANKALLWDNNVPEPLWDYRPAVSRKLRADGLVRSAGWGEVRWYWGLLELGAYNFLKAYCADTSASVFINTKITSTVYDDFSAVMIWPEKENWSNGNLIDFEIIFIKVEAE